MNENLDESKNQMQSDYEYALELQRQEYEIELENINRILFERNIIQVGFNGLLINNADIQENPEDIQENPEDIQENPEDIQEDENEFVEDTDQEEDEEENDEYIEEITENQWQMYDFNSIQINQDQHEPSGTTGISRLDINRNINQVVPNIISRISFGWEIEGINGILNQEEFEKSVPVVLKKIELEKLIKNKKSYAELEEKYIDICENRCLCQETIKPEKEEDETKKIFMELPCNHFYHEECILPWLEKYSFTCPVCKYEFTEREAKI
jgi:hypothetical protein